MLTTFFSFCSFFSFGQYKELKFKHFSKDAGLSSSNVTCFAQAQDGTLWIGTTDGLNQFDGYSFKIYRNDPEDSLSICDNHISALFIDYKGDLWIGTVNNGLSKYNPKTGRFKNYKHKVYDSGTLSSRYITSITEDANKNLWIGTMLGLNLYNRERDDFQRYFYELEVKVSEQTVDSLKAHGVSEYVTTALGQLLNIESKKESAFFKELSQLLSEKELKLYKNMILRYANLGETGDQISALEADKNGNLWMGYRKEGLACFNPLNKTIKTYRLDRDALSKENSEIVSLCLNKKDVWLGTRDGRLFKWNAETDSLVPFPLPDYAYNIEAIVVDSKGTLWVGDDYGLCRQMKNEKEFQRYQNQENNKYSLAATAVKAIFEDRNKNLWVGCNQGGINLTIDEIPFEHFQHYPNSSGSLSKNCVSTVLEDSEGNIWIGYYTMGIDVKNKRTGQVTHYTHRQGDLTSLGKGTVFEIFEDREGNIWIGTFEGGLQFFDKRNKRFITYKHQPDNKESIGGNDVRAIAEDENGTLWLAIHGHGINAFDKRTKTAKRYYAHHVDWQNSLANDWVFTVYVDKQGNVWSGSVFGLSVLKKGAENFVTYNKENRNLSHNNVRVILEDRKGNIWLGTENGLNLFNRQTTNFKVYTEKDGLPNNAIKGILEDGKGNLWISTNQGVARFDPHEEVFISYSALDGLQSDEFFEGAYYKGKSGAMYFGGTNGLNVFYPEHVFYDTSAVPLRFTELRLFNKTIEPGSAILPTALDFTESITLKHDQNVVSFLFAGLNFRNPEKVQYAYLLEGFESDWNYVGNKREATYTNLKPGEYVFKVKASQVSGHWSDDIKELKITVLPPIWLSPAAYALYVLLILGLVYYYKHSAVVRERLKNKLELQKLEAQKAQELDAVKLRFFTSISHEFRTPLTLILDPIDHLMAEDSMMDATQRKEYYSLLKGNSQRLLRLINQLLDLSEIEAGCMKLAIVKYDVVGFCRSIADTFVYRAKQQKIKYHFFSNINEAEVFFDHDIVEKVMINLICNALKFTEAGGMVSVNLLLTNQQNTDLPPALLSPGLSECQFICLTVEDTGSGIPEKHLQKIFDRFYQVENPSARKAGTGIGLALARQLVERHKGTIEVKSKEGEGSTFTVWLPVSKEVYAREQILEVEEKSRELLPDEDLLLDRISRTEEVANGKSQELPIVLVVEDCDDLRTYLSSHLKKEYMVYEAANGREGFEKAMDVNPDIVISDVMMPEMDGFELCKKLKSDAATCHMPVVLLTARSTAVYELEGLQLGADDYISKPFSMPLVKARIRNLLQLRQRIKDKLLTDVNFAPKDIAINTIDKCFVGNMIEKIELNIADENFSPEMLADLMNLSRSQLYKKVKGLTGLSVSIFIRNIRLRKAAQLLENQDVSISEVAYQVGFSDPNYFTKCFKETYGKSPSKYLQKYHEGNVRMEKS